MLGLMQDWPLLVHKILDHAALNHGDREVVTRSVEGPIRRTNYRAIHSRARRIAKALEKAGVVFGDRVATLAWNTDRHLETWYGITGLGAVYHTLNPRLFPEQLVYIANHAEDRVLFFDITFAKLVEQLAPKLPSIKLYVAMTDRAHLPAENIPNLVAYEDFIADVDDDFTWAEFDENTACGLCYTSGTTGNPKGVLYSHRSNVLHAMIAGQTDAMGIGNDDTILPVVPMFHANAWAIAFTAPMIGAKLVMPGAKLDGPSVYELLDTEQVTMTAAVPTVWLMLLQDLEKTGKMLPHLKRVHDRRLGLPAFDDRYLRKEIRSRRHACVGHDGNEPDRHAGLGQVAFEARDVRRPPRRQDQAGPCAVHRRDEDHGRRRPHAAE